MSISKTLKSDQKDTENVVEKLKKSLQKRTSCELFDFPYISQAAIINLGKALEENKTLTSLSLDCNCRTPSHMIPILEALKKNKNLINLSLISLNVSSLQYLAKLLKTHQIQLKNLNCALHEANNDMNEKTTEILSIALKKADTLTTLSLYGHKINARAAKALAENKHLKRLDLSGSDMNLQAVTALATALQKNKTLNTLHLNWSIPPEGLHTLSKTLETNRSLIKSGLADNKITDKHLQPLTVALQKNRTLTSLGLARNPLGDKGIELLSKALENSPCLAKLNLADTGITHQGIKHLVSLLKNNQSLTELDLSHNPFDIDSIKMLTEALKKNRTLIKLHLTLDVKDDKSYTALADLLKENTTITSLNLETLSSLHSLQTSKESYSTIVDSLKRNDNLARQQKRKALTKELESQFPPVLANLVTSYAGTPPKTKKNTAHQRSISPLQLPPSKLSDQSSFLYKCLNRLYFQLERLYFFFKKLFFSQAAVPIATPIARSPKPVPPAQITPVSSPYKPSLTINTHTPTLIANGDPILPVDRKQAKMS